MRFIMYAVRCITLWCECAVRHMMLRMPPPRLSESQMSEWRYFLFINYTSMRFKSLLNLSLALFALGWSATASATEVTVTMNTMSKTMTLKPVAGGDAVAIGEPSADYSPKYQFTCDPGDYVASLFDASGESTGSIVLTVEGETMSTLIYNITCYAANKTDGVEWKLGEDYDIPFENIKVSTQKGESHTVTPVKYDANNRTSVVFPCLLGDSYEVRFIPLGDNADTYAESVQSGTITGNRTVSCTLPVVVKFTLTAPKEASVIVAQKPGSRHYVPFKEYDYSSAVESGNDIVYTYHLPQASNYNYRVSQPGCITHAGIFDPSNGDIAVTEEQLKEYPSDYYNHDVTANGGFNYADIYLNINPQGHLFMQPDGEFHLVNLRTWQLTNSITANYFLEPDYHYTVLNTKFEPDNSVVEVDASGLIKAKSQGTAIVQVRYDAMKTEVAGGNLWSSIWAENVGTFVVTVGDRPEGMKSNMKLPYEQPNRTGEIDAEHDIFYYPEGTDGYDFTFTPEGASTVLMANPVVDLKNNTLSYPDGFSSKNITKNSDGSYTVRLTYGRNIICLEDAFGHSIYQVLSAKPVSYTYGQEVRSDKYNLPGDVVTVKFSGLYHDAGKLAAIYNQGCSPKYAVIPDGYTDKTVSGYGGQYNFAANQGIRITLLPDQKAGKFELKDGCLTFGGFGDKLGGHRDIDYLTGRNPNFAAQSQSQLAGVIPDISFETDAFTDGMELSLRLEYGKNATPVSVAAAKEFLGEDMTMTSSDEKIAKVDENGKVTAGADGTAVITYASASGDKKFTCKVEVWSIKVEGIAFKNDVIEATTSASGYSLINFGVVWTPANASNKGLTFIFSNPDIIDFRNNTHYTKKGVAGETDVTVITDDGGYKATCHLILRMRMSSMSLDKKEAAIEIGETLKLEPIFNPENTDPKFRGIEWTSDHPEVASVDQNGLVTALTPGTAVITAQSLDSKFRHPTCTVTVSEKSGIENVSAATVVSAWPNPFTDYIIVETSEAAIAEVYNIQGSLLIRTEVATGQNRIDTSALAPGIYLVRVGTETVKMIRK